MEILLAILLYLHVIFSPGTYTKNQINDYEIMHRPEIEAVHADEAQMRIVNEEYLPQVEHIWILDDSNQK